MQDIDRSESFATTEVAEHMHTDTSNTFNTFSGPTTSTKYRNSALDNAASKAPHDGNCKTGPGGRFRRTQKELMGDKSGVVSNVQ
jgi:hypothetical protein